MPISKKIAHNMEEVDVIICGGGVGACVAAGSLARVDPSLSILVIEGGENNEGKEDLIVPALWVGSLAPTSSRSIAYKAKKSKELAGRELVVQTGGVLGGGSSINIMLYSRARRSDFDSWSTPGWSTDELLPLMKRIETYHSTGRESVHGFNGPLIVTGGPSSSTRAENELIASAVEMGYKKIDDMQDPDTTENGVDHVRRTIDLNGKRSDAATAYIHPLLEDGQHKNLHILCESKVNRVLFDDNKRAVGVEYVPVASGEKLTVKARKLVVVSCGAMGSPLVLERSGVGSKEVLESASVPLVAEVPGVGNNYQDHHFMSYPYKSNQDPTDTYDALFFGRMSAEEAARCGLLSASGNTFGAKLRPSKTEVAAMGPEFQTMWDREFRDNPNRPLMLTAGFNAMVDDPSRVVVGQHYSMGCYTAYPHSRGSMHITGPDWQDPCDFESGFFKGDGELDIKSHLWFYKVQREIIRRTPMYRGEVGHAHPPFPTDSKAALVNLDKPAVLLNGAMENSALYGSGDAKAPFEYTAEDDALIEQHIRATVQTTWHSMGTCKMAPMAEMGVVDADLNVYGVQGLKVIDLSIAPCNVAANTANTAFIIGEKGADIILKELGLKEVVNGVNGTSVSH